MMIRSLVQRALTQVLGRNSGYKALAFEFPFFTSVFPSIPSIPTLTPSRSIKYLSPSILKRSYCTQRNENRQELFKNTSQQSGFKVQSPAPSGSSTSSNTAIAMYAVAALVAVGGLSYAAVPLYKMFCAATGYAGTTKVADSKTKAKIVYDHPITIRFTSQVSDTLPWSFTPVQREMTVLPGEKALAFYVATNHHPSDALVGVATYNVVPDLSGAYFNKIQCFCFDEQRLNPGETVNMPIHFFIDPSIEDDKVLRGINEITLSYTFFLAEDQSAEWWEEERDKHARPTSS